MENNVQNINAVEQAVTPAFQVEGNVAQNNSSNDSSKEYFAIASLIIGVINLCAWFIAICGCGFGILGIVLGVLGLKSEKNKTIAIVGIVLSTIGLIVAIINGIAGVAM